jgi:mRNA-degrading endonuclease YafQ of YafQ-DinJ toxin-antitoxin module
LKKYTSLFLLSVQILFSQEIVVRGQAFNSEKFNDHVVYIIKNDTINKLRKHSKSLYTYWNENSKFKKRLDDSYKKASESSEILHQIFSNKYYKTKTDSLGYFEINAKLSDSLFFESNYHITKKYLVADLVKKKKINVKLILKPCEVWPSHQEKPSKLYVFIGKKIKIWDSPAGYCNGIPLDSRTIAKYSVVKNIYGDFKKDIIQFTSYTHSHPLEQNYIPFKTSFVEYDYCLLYVLEFKGELIQVKYLFDDVYKTKEGNWASPLKPKGLFNTISSDAYKPEKISFPNPVEFEYEDRFYKEIYQNFPAAYNTVKDGKITVNDGYYVEDLFEIRKAGRLKEYDYLIK